MVWTLHNKGKRITELRTNMLMHMGRFNTTSAIVRTTALAGAFVALSATATQAQGKGVIQGKVIDESTGEAMRSATVLVMGTKLGARSDVKGGFKIKDIPEGTYSIRVSFIGYQAKVIEKIVVKAGKPTQLDISLKPESKTTEEVVVTATRSKDNAAAILNERKNSAQVSDGIASEEIKKLPASDAGDALKRVSGVTVQGGKYVYVRGVSERYNNTTLNGAALSSTEPDKKAFSFDMFPTDFLQNANVSKSFTPDMPGNFVGGLVQLTTVDFPSGTSFKVSASQGANSMVTLRDNAFVGYQGGSTDWLGIDDGTRSLPSSFPDQAQLRTLRDAARTNDATKKQEWASVGAQLNSQSWTREASTVTPNGSFALSFSDIFQIAENDFGLIASANYSNGYSLNEMTRAGILSDPKSRLFETQGYQSTQSVNWGGMLNLAYKIGGHSSVSFKNMYNRSADDEVIQLDGFNSPQDLDIRQISYQYVERSLISSSVAGEHTLADMSNMLVDWRLGYSVSERDEPDFRRLRYSRLTGEDQPFRADLGNTQQGDGTLAGRFFSNLQENLGSGGLNITIPLTPDSKIKFGGAFETKDRSFSARSLTLIQARAITGLSNNSELFRIRALSPDSVFAAANYSPDLVGMSEDSKASDSYSAVEQLQAAYVMGDTKFDVGGLPVRVIGGVRVENSSQRLNSFSAITAQPVAVNLNILDWLPSLNFVVSLADDQNLRLSASRTLTRPTLREFAPFSFYDFQTQAVVRGNENLIRALIQNYDVRYEWFPNPGEVFSVSGFFKRFDNAIEETIFPEASEIQRTFVNAPAPAINYGVELEGRKSLGFLGDIFNPFLLSANLSFVTSEIEVLQGNRLDKRQMWGQAPYSFNFALGYQSEEFGTSVNVSYNIVGRKIVQVALQGVYQVEDPHVYELPRDVIDLSVIQPAGPFEFKLTVRDLLNQKLEWEQAGQIVASNLRGRTVALGMSFRAF